MMIIPPPQPIERKLLYRGNTFDVSLVWMVLLLLGFGWVMVYSASSAYALADRGNAYFYAIRHGAFLCIGLFFLWVTTKIPLKIWCSRSVMVLVCSLLLLALVYFIGTEVNGARRWLRLGPVNIQASEVFKLAVIVYLSGFIMRRVHELSRLKRVWWVMLPIGLGLWLVLREPDLGSVVVISIIAVGLLFLAGLPWKWFGLTVLLGVLVIAALIVSEPYRLVRVSTFLDPWQDPLNTGYQLSQSLMSIGRGYWKGMGLGAGIGQRFFLPEAHTDFIFAIISEELGFIGGSLLAMCYGWLVWRAAAIGRQAHNLGQLFGSLLAYGVTIWVGVQSFFNIGVNMGLLPTKGLTLPLISYGGSSMVMMLIALGLLIRVDIENRMVIRGFRV
ncbi:putative lipid II flippase FtsW [Stenoxybacter acetivorans]|uniref:putative lipid II flippase FtsW n=1 Tax=Stenoxybacter acetivorans TaxID=422441 RepID=UPI000AC869D9|nr:putative lipid II flippase FtsW [Stenoxybacter acetivorans]